MASDDKKYEVSGLASTYGASSQDLTQPPPRDNRLAVWALLGLCLLLAAGPMLLVLNRPDVTDSSEAECITYSIHSWQRYKDTLRAEGHTVDEISPTFQSESRLRHLPGLVWLHQNAFSFPWSTDFTTDALVFRARLISVAMALLTVASIYWAGVSMGGLVTGLFAALISLAHPILIHSGRVASTPVYHLGWVLLSTAAALWAIRPLKPTSGLLRQAVGWGTCGLALGASILTVGPVAILEVCIPVFGMLVLCPKRFNYMMGLLAALLIGLLLVLPWAGHMQAQDPGIWRDWLRQLFPVLGSDLGGQAMTFARRTIFIMIILLPWTVWLIGGVLQPFSVSSAGVRGRMSLVWVWFVSVVVMQLVLFRIEKPHEMLGIVPPFAVLLGQLFHHYAELAAGGRFVRSWRILRWVFIILLPVASILVPLFLIAQQPLLGVELTGHISWLSAIGMGLVLLLVAALGTRWAIEQHPGRALILWAIWVLALEWMVVVPIASGPIAVNPVRLEARRVAHVARSHPIYFVHQPVQDGEGPSSALMLYLGRPLQQVVVDEVANLAQMERVSFLLTRADLSTGGFECQLITHLKSVGLDLWRLGPVVEDAQSVPSVTEGDHSAAGRD